MTEGTTTPPVHGKTDMSLFSSLRRISSPHKKPTLSYFYQKQGIFSGWRKSTARKKTRRHLSAVPFFQPVAVSFRCVFIVPWTSGDKCDKPRFSTRRGDGCSARPRFCFPRQRPGGCTRGISRPARRYMHACVQVYQENNEKER